jgi:hypothetical protein
VVQLTCYFRRDIPSTGDAAHPTVDPEVMPMSPSLEPVVLPVASWGEFGLLLATKLRRRSFLLKCATCQSHGTRIQIRLVLPNDEHLELRGRVIDSVRDEERGTTVWVTRLSLEQLPDAELVRWEQLSTARPRKPTVSPLPSLARSESAPPVRVRRTTTLGADLFDDVPRAKEPPVLLSVEERLEHEMATARGATARGDHAAAIEALQRALELCPGAAVLEARLSVARARQAAELGQTSLVESLVEHAQALSPGCIRPDDPLLLQLRPARKSRSPFSFLRRPS